MAIDDESGSESNWDSDTEIYYKEEVDAANEAELKQYARKELSLDLDGSEADLSWLAWEAFVATPPEGWTEHVDKAGRVFFYSQQTNESRWSHPGDEVFRDLVNVVKTTRKQRPLPSEKQRSRVLQEHLLEMYKRAEEDLKGWSGPHEAEDGGQYFYSSVLKQSTWEHPHERWERELALRNAVLHRCLMQEWPKELEPPASQEEAAADIRPLFLSYEALSLKTEKKADGAVQGDDEDISLCSARSFATMRSSCSLHSTCSARSMRSARSSRSTRSLTPSLDKKQAARGTSPRSLHRTRSAGTLPPPLPATNQPISVPPPLLRTQSQTLPRFGSADDSSTLPHLEAQDSSPSPSPVEGESAPVKAPAPPQIRPCKSALPCKVPDPETVAPAPKSPPEPKSSAALAKSSVCKVDTVESPERALMRARSTTEVAMHTENTSPEKEEKGKGWLPEHAQRIIQRHMGDAYMGAPDSPTSIQKLNEGNELFTRPVVPQATQDADVAGGVPADDAAAGDAAVLALLDKCAPAASAAELQKLQERIEKTEKTEQPTMSPAGSNNGQPEMSPTSSMGSFNESRAQFFNLWESDPDCEEAEKVHQWLKKLGLGRYFEQLALEGFDDMNILANLEEKQITELMETCPMPMLHEQQLRRGLSRLSTDASDADLPPTPL